jgi:membrane protease YdiL (CAAX protease family)
VEPVIISSLIFVIGFEPRFLRRYSEVCFQRALRGFLPYFIAAAAAGLAGWIILPGGIYGAAFFFWGSIAAFYARARRRWIRELDVKEARCRGGFSRVPRLAAGAFGVVLHWALGLILLQVIYGIWAGFTGAEMPVLEGTAASSAFSSALIITLVFCASGGRSPRGFRFKTGWRRRGIPAARLYLWPAFLGLFLAGVSSAMLQARDVQPSTPMNEILETAGSSSMVLVFLGLALVIAPLVEELTFRGYFFHVLREVRGRSFAVAAVSAVFVLLHVPQYWGDWPAIGVVGVLGFGLTWLRASTGSTIASAVAHYTYNAAAVLIPAAALVAQNPAYVEYHARHDLLSSQQKEELLLENIERNPRFAAAYHDLARLYAGERRELDLALALVDKALAREPGNPVWLDTRAEVLTGMGHYRQALEIREDLAARIGSGVWAREQEDKIRELKGL